MPSQDRTRSKARRSRGRSPAHGASWLPKGPSRRHQGSRADAGPSPAMGIAHREQKCRSGRLRVAHQGQGVPPSMPCSSPGARTACGRWGSGRPGRTGATAGCGSGWGSGSPTGMRRRRARSVMPCVPASAGCGVCVAGGTGSVGAVSSGGGVVGEGASGWAVVWGLAVVSGRAWASGLPALLSGAPGWSGCRDEAVSGVAVRGVVREGSVAGSRVRGVVEAVRVAPCRGAPPVPRPSRVVRGRPVPPSGRAKASQPGSGDGDDEAPPDSPPAALAGSDARAGPVGSEPGSALRAGMPRASRRPRRVARSLLGGPSSSVLPRRRRRTTGPVARGCRSRRSSGGLSCLPGPFGGGTGGHLDRVGHVSGAGGGHEGLQAVVVRGGRGGES